MGSKYKSGFTLVEILIDVAVISMVTTAVLAAFSAGFKSITQAKAKIEAVSLANEKMEELRNMSYDSLSTQSGAILPHGSILDDQQIVRGGIKLKVHTEIVYVDDPYDGCADAGSTGSPKSECLKNMTAGKPQDVYPYDYKKVEITVGKVGSSNYLARLTSNFSAKAAETASNTGIIKLCAIDSTGATVSDAKITIDNIILSPNIHIEASTGSDGCIMEPLLPPDTHGGYHLTVTKDGYSTDMTYARTPQNPNALQPNVNVSVQDVTSQNLIIDKLGTLNINVSNTTGAAVQNATVHINGSKLIYNNPDTLKYSETRATDGSGNIQLSNIEFDSYNFSIDNWSIATVEPYAPVYLKPGAIQNIKIIVTNSSDVPKISTLSPSNGVVNGSVSITITGGDFDNSITAKLVNPTTNSEISGQNIAVNGHNTITVDFDLTGATSGLWNVVLTNPSGGSSTQTNGFEIKDS